MPNLDKSSNYSKGFSLITLIIIIAFVVGILVILQKSFNGPKRQCPDQWVVSRAPGNDQSQARKQYLIVDGKRGELEDYDLNWIQEQCKVNKPEEAYK